MIELESPQIEPVEEVGTYAKYEVGPLQAGYGVTLGNALRRVPDPVGRPGAAPVAPAHKPQGSAAAPSPAATSIADFMDSSIAFPPLITCYY